MNQTYFYSFDCLLSLGFGRPPSQPIMEAIDTNLFLSVLASRPLAPPSVGAYDFLSAQAGDYFIASQAQLMQISRDFIRSVEAMRLEAEVTDAVDIGMTTTVMDLNQRLDQWCRSWVWSVSTILLSSFIQVVERLQLAWVTECTLCTLFARIQS